ncbi:hypothetical protein M011DRAFT_480834 [Sporormia fimetaria CBS 119925]|uniref:Uncharacterized protein n=1 Tax=Sporormia fimetaria CBS 119925 TaxID=1340428 RepID=A0A6A6V0F4_9PLEO|nr:hypothetical protein M011DRAFT_480834 [Sporormia fimetaria CBS 119925]
MSYSMIRTVAASRPFTSRMAIPFTRTYAQGPHGQSRASPGQSSNVSDTNASSPEAKGVLNSRATEGSKQQDTKSTHTPVSNPEESGIGGQEETTESQGAMKRDPNEPAEKKREKVLEYGQNKPLDPADK